MGKFRRNNTSLASPKHKTYDVLMKSANYLQQTEQGLCLNHEGQILQIDFLSGAFQKRLRETGKKSTLFKAVGSDKNTHIIDMTTGLGRDCFLLAHRGHTITAFEQSDALFLLLQDALERARSRFPETVSRIHLQHGDSLSLIQSAQEADIVYCDPMFPERKKSALVKKDMQIMQQLIGHNDNAEPLLERAKQFAKQRVVLKRPKLSEVIDKPDIQFTSKTHRFDVYLARPAAG